MQQSVLQYFTKVLIELVHYPYICLINKWFMKHELIVENEFSYIESGEGRPIVILHGLMGKLSNFKGVYEYFPKKN